MAALAPGARIGGYEIVAPLRAGGMASFYLGRRTGPAGFTRPIGIKVVHAHLAEDRSFVDMFLDEARLSARIVHPNVVHVEELGEVDGVFFLAMELVHGAPLSALLRRVVESKHVLRPAVACAIAMRVADGLHAAHEVRDDRGELLEVVHRDVSPQNVLVGADGRVKLIDFGIAKARGRIQETEGGSLKGKLRYMSPEQAWGRPIDRRTDVYALGIVLWESLTGRRLFGGESDVDALELVRAPRIPPPSRFAADVLPALDAALATALAPDPADRFDTAQAFRRAIGNACPEATKVEADEIGALVRTLLADDLAKERALLASWEGAAPAPRASDAELATHTMNETRQIPSDEPVATIAPTRVAPLPATAVATPPGPGPSRVRAPAAAVVGLALVGGLGWGGWQLFRGPEDPCATVVAIPAGSGERVVVPFDTRAAPVAFQLHGMRNPAFAGVGTVAFSYAVPGTGARTVHLDTAIEPTSPRFDTIVGVYRGVCGLATVTNEPDVLIDDDERVHEYRARGSFRAQGGESLTIVLSGYGGHVRGRDDEGAGAIAIETLDPRPPVLHEASLRVEGSIVTVEVHAEDPDGDSTGARIRFESRDGAPVATIPFPVGDRPAGAFVATGALDVGAEGARTMTSAATAEVSVLDADGNASAPLEVPVTIVASADARPADPRAEAAPAGVVSPE